VRGEAANGRKSGKNMFAMMTLQAPSGLGAALGSPLVMMVIVMGIFYVMLILPQQRQRKKLQAMLAALKAGDKVITNGGIYGVINGIDGDTVILKIADTGSSPVKIRIARSAITQVEASEDAK
jgi:preprotein translocase subunit YajC